MQALVEAVRFDINTMYQMKINYEVDYYSCINGASFRSIKNWTPHILCVYCGYLTLYASLYIYILKVSYDILEMS